MVKFMNEKTTFTKDRGGLGRRCLPPLVLELVLSSHLLIWGCLLIRESEVTTHYGAVLRGCLKAANGLLWPFAIIWNMVNIFTMPPWWVPLSVLQNFFEVGKHGTIFFALLKSFLTFFRLSARSLVHQGL